MIIAQSHILRTDADLVLIVSLVFVKGEVLIDILHIGEGLVTGIKTLCLLVIVRRVALRHVDTLIAVKDRSLSGIQVSTTEVMIVIIGRVGIPSGTHTVVDTDATQEICIGRFGSFLFVGKSIETHILLGSRAG